MESNERVIARADDQPVTVRFPEGLVARLDDASKRAGRSRNTEIIMRLLTSFEPKNEQNSTSKEAA